MALQSYILSFPGPLASEHPGPLVRLLTLRGNTAQGLYQSVGQISESLLARPPPSQLQAPWDSIALRHCACVHAYSTRNYKEAYDHQTQLLSLFYRWFIDQASWCLPVLYRLLEDLRHLAELADSSLIASTGKVIALEECSRTVSKAFTLCTTDRTNTGADSRRMGVYHVACLSLKCYFRVDKPNLCKNIIRAVTSDANTPPVDTAPMRDQVTWHFYLGLLAFMAGNDRTAEQELTWALDHCPLSAHRNVELILTYLIPLNLLSARFPSPALLARFPRLAEVFGPFIEAIRTGRLREYDERLEWAQARLVSMRVFLTVERAREGCLRTLFKRAWIASDRSSRMPLSTFKLALELQGLTARPGDRDADFENEVECMVANMIHRGFIKGYISHEKQMVVLGKTNPFPSVASVPR